MKIGYDAKRIFHNRTGLGNYGRDIVRILDEYEFIAHFFLFNTKKSPFSNSVPLEKASIIYPKKWFWRKFPALWRLFGQWAQIKSAKVDWYHGLSGEIPIQFKKNDIKKMVTVHDLIFLSHPQYYNFFDRIIYRLKFQHAVSVADHVIAISEQTKSDIIKYLRVNPKKISVVYQGCNNVFKREYSNSEKERVIKKFNIPKEFILNVGTLQERKNVLALIKAINGTDYQVVLVGKKKKYARNLEDYIAIHNLESQVHFIDNISSEELAIVYQSATLFCYPSICEGFGIPIIEALYSKIPVIVTAKGCFPEAAGPFSIYINDPNDPSEIRKKIDFLFENVEARLKMSEKGYEFVQRFSDENVAQELIAIYKSSL